MGLLSRILIAGSTLHPRKCLKTAGQDGKVKQSAGAPAAALLLLGRHRFTFSGGGGGSDQYVFDRGGGEGRAGRGGGRTNIGWRRGERRRGGGGTRSRLQRLLWKYFSNCRRKRIDHCRAPKQTFTRLRQDGMEKWQTHRHAEFCTVAPKNHSPQKKKTKWKINRNFAVCIDSCILGYFAEVVQILKCIFFYLFGNGASAAAIWWLLLHLARRSCCCKPTVL